MDIGDVVSIFSGNQLVQMCANVRERQLWKNFAYYRVIFFFVLSGGFNHYARQIVCSLSFSYLQPKYWNMEGSVLPWDVISQPEGMSYTCTECVLSAILGSREEKMVTWWRKLHIEKSHSLISSPHIFRLIN